jgi:hypothetical protein
MKKHISNHLRMATIVMGITLATSAMASEDHKDSKANANAIDLTSTFTIALTLPSTIKYD